MSKQQQQRAPRVQFDAEHQYKIVDQALSDPREVQEIKLLLGPDVDYDRFASTTREVLKQKPDLLEPTPAFRNSLFFSLKKAAKQGLEPDGVQGALIPRYNSDAKCMLVQWQPMVRGVMLAAKRVGIKKITADYVLVGEPFRHLRGDDERIEHEWKADIREKAYSFLRQIRLGAPDPNAPPDEQKPTMQIGRDFDAFWDMIAAAYAVFTLADGEKVRRAMPRTRLLLLRDASKSKGGSPWWGPFVDEMIVKCPIHFTAKHVPMDVADPERRARILRFKDILDDGMEADFEDDGGDDRPMIEGRAERDPPPPANVASLPAPNLGDKLAQFENLGDDQRERVSVGNDRGEAQQQQQRRQDPPQQDQGQPQGQQGQGKPQPQRQGDLPHQGGQQGGQGASQGQPQQQSTGTDLAPLNEEDRALAAAKEFAAETVGFIHNSNQHQLDQAFGAPPNMAGNAALLRRLDKLKAAFPALHKQITDARTEREQALAQQRQAA